MTESVKGKSLGSGGAVRAVPEMVTSAPDVPIDDLGKLSVLAGVREFPVRVKCASLPWHTLPRQQRGEDRYPPNETAAYGRESIAPVVGYGGSLDGRVPILLEPLSSYRRSSRRSRRSTTRRFRSTSTSSV